LKTELYLCFADLNLNKELQNLFHESRNFTFEVEHLIYFSKIVKNDYIINTMIGLNLLNTLSFQKINQYIVNQLIILCLTYNKYDI